MPKGKCRAETVTFHRAIGACNAPVQTPEPLQRASADDGGIADDDRVGYRQKVETQWTEAGGQSGSFTIGLAAENQGLDSGSAKDVPAQGNSHVGGSEEESGPRPELSSSCAPPLQGELEEG